MTNATSRVNVKKYKYADVTPQPLGSASFHLGSLEHAPSGDVMSYMMRFQFSPVDARTSVTMAVPNDRKLAWELRWSPNLTWAKDWTPSTA